MSPFNLAEDLSAFLKDPSSCVENVETEDFSFALNSLTDTMAISPDAIAEDGCFNTAKYLLNSFSDLSNEVRAGLVDLLVSGAGGVLQTDHEGAIFQDLLERYFFLFHWYLIESEKLLTQSHTSVVRFNARSKANGEASAVIDGIVAVLAEICKCLKPANTLFTTTSEKDMFSSLYLRPIYLLMENEQAIKNPELRLRMFKCIGLAVKFFHQHSGIQTSLLQLLTYFEHLAEHLAELMQILYEQYDHTTMIEDLLREISGKTFNSNDSKGPKTVSLFLIKLSQLIPMVVLRHITLLIKLLDSESFALRCAIVEISGNIVVHTCASESDLELHKTQVNALLDLIEERVMDVSYFCRSRSIQVLSSICDLDTKFPKRRPGMMKLAVRGLRDKSVMVRRNVTKLIAKLISTHPFGLLHGSQLKLSEWQSRLKSAENELDAIAPSKRDDDTGNLSTFAVDALDAPSDDEDGNTRAELQEKSAHSTADVQLINKLELTIKYYSEAVEFILQVHEALAQAQVLLMSKSKGEIIECMDLFVLADAYGIECAKVGIRKMIHLIWTKANNDEGQAIQSHLIQCYSSLFFDAPLDMSESDANLLVAKNLISLTYGSTLAELASLEKLLIMSMEKDDLISPGIIRTLWKIYSYQHREISRTQRRGAIIVLGMLSKADNAIAVSGTELILKIGLGEQGRNDLGLAKYSCIALQQCVSENDWKTAISRPARLPVTNEAIALLADIVLMPSEDMEWFGVAEQAIKAINELSDTPDIVLSEVIKAKTRAVFDGSGTVGGISKEAQLSQLLFVVGDVTLKTMVHLERCEALFKRSKLASEKATASLAKENPEDDDLNAAAGGTTEDDFTEAISFVREREMLFGQKSLLTRYGSMVAALCQQSLSSAFSEMLSVSTTLCLAKFMCVSSSYCESNLILLMSLMEKSDNATIRSNCVLALGDMAVCFNYMLDEKADFLYRRLHDPLPVVQRTCLMTLTFLILAGQVKVRGQLGEMAKCLEDSDKRISDLARLFFNELSTKENAIYNGFIDVFSMLSADRQLDEESLHRILKFLIGFIDKEKQVKQLSDKLHSRMARCDTQKSWSDISYVLGLLPHKSEAISHSIAEGFKYTPQTVA